MGFCRWALRDSNPRPLPCRGADIDRRPGVRRQASMFIWVSCPRGSHGFPLFLTGLLGCCWVETRLPYPASAAPTMRTESPHADASPRILLRISAGRIRRAQVCRSPTLRGVFPWGPTHVHTLTDECCGVRIVCGLCADSVQVTAWRRCTVSPNLDPGHPTPVFSADTRCFT